MTTESVGVDTDDDEGGKHASHYLSKSAFSLLALGVCLLVSVAIARLYQRCHDKFSVPDDEDYPQMAANVRSMAATHHAMHKFKAKLKNGTLPPKENEDATKSLQKKWLLFASGRKQSCTVDVAPDWENVPPVTPVEDVISWLTKEVLPAGGGYGSLEEQCSGLIEAISNHSFVEYTKDVNVSDHQKDKAAECGYANKNKRSSPDNTKESKVTTNEMPKYVLSTLSKIVDDVSQTTSACASVCSDHDSSSSREFPILDVPAVHDKYAVHSIPDGSVTQQSGLNKDIKDYMFQRTGHIDGNGSKSEQMILNSDECNDSNSCQQLVRAVLTPPGTSTAWDNISHDCSKSSPITQQSPITTVLSSPSPHINSHNKIRPSTGSRTGPITDGQAAHLTPGLISPRPSSPRKASLPASHSKTKVVKDIVLKSNRQNNSNGTTPLRKESNGTRKQSLSHSPLKYATKL